MVWSVLAQEVVMYTKVQLVLTEDLHQRLRQAALRRGVSMSQFAREALVRALEEEAEARRARRRQVLEELAAVRHALEEAGVKPMSGDEIAEMIRQMREERLDELTRNALGH